MAFLQNVFRKINNSDIIMLGRWTINYDLSNIKTKVHQANHDHCGVCDTTYYHNSTHMNKIKNNDISKSKYMIIVKSKVNERNYNFSSNDS